MATEDEILKFGVEVDPRPAITAFDKVQKAISNHIQDINKESQSLGKKTSASLSKIGDAYKVAIVEAGKAQKQFGENLSRVSKDQAKVQEKYVQGLKKKSDVERKIGSYRRQEDKLSKAISKTDRKDKDSIEMGRAMMAKMVEERKHEEKLLNKVNGYLGKQKDTFGQLNSEAETYRRALEGAEKTSEEMKDNLANNIAERPAAIARSMKEGGELFGAPMKAILHDDLPAAFGAAAKILGKGLIAGAQFARSRAESGGGGGKMKALAGGIEKMSGAFARFAPIIGALGDGLKTAFQTFLKLDTIAKSFNKQVWEASATADTLGAHGGDASAAFKQLHGQMEEIRDVSYDLSNIRYGLKPEDFTNTLNALGQEGVSAQRLATEAEKAQKSVGQLTRDLTLGAVAFSKSMHVSVGEITTMMANMTTEIGVNADKTTEKLQLIQEAGVESGMGATKFFNIIRGMSDDFTLFNNRMEDAARIMTMLGKSMSPKEANKFFQALTGGLKGMDLEGGIKVTLLAGKEKTQNILQKDTDRKMGDMVKELGLGAEDSKALLEAMHKSPEATAKMLAKNRKLTGAQKSAAMDAAIMNAKIQSGNLVEIASAIKNASPSAAYDIYDSVAQARFGKPLEQLEGTERLAMEKLGIGFTSDMIDSSKKAKASATMLQGEIVSKLQNGEDLTRQETAVLDKLGIPIKDMNTQTGRLAAIQAVSGKSDKQMWDASQSIDQAHADGVKETNDLLKAQQGDTQSAEESLRAINNWLQHELIKHLGAGGAGVVAGAVEVGGGLAKTAVEMTLVTKAMKSLPRLLGGATEAAATGAAETAAAAAAEAAVPAAATAATGSGLLAGAGAAATAVAAAISTPVLATGAAVVGLGVAANEVRKASDDLGESMFDVVKGVAKMAVGIGPEAKSKPLTPSEYDKKYGIAPTATTSTAAPATPAVNPAPVEVKGAPLDDLKKGMNEVVQATKDTGIAEVTKTIRDQNELTLTDGFGVLAGILRRDVKLNKSFVENELGPMVEKRVLDAVRVALVEYSLYRDMSSASLATSLKQSGDAKGFVQGQVEAATAHAAGGFVTGKNPDGTAKVIKAPAGEMPTTIGAGETIVPRGGGGGGGTNVNVTVNGIGGADLANMVKVAATNAIYDYKRRENLH